MKLFTKIFTPLVLTVGVAIIVIGLLTSDAFGQNPTGNPDWPLWTRTSQGKTIVYGDIDCTIGGATFAGGGQSLMMQNVGTEYITVCPNDGSCTVDNGWRIAANAALILDKANAGAAEWKCFGSGGTRDLRYIMER